MYQVEWILENRIVLLRPIGEQTIESLREDTARLNEYIASGEPPVHIINDNRYLGKFPASVKLLTEINVLGDHENIGHTVSIGGNAVAKFISKVLARRNDNRPIDFKTSFTEALSLLKSVDHTLPGAIAYEDTLPQEFTLTS